YLPPFSSQPEAGVEIPCGGEEQTSFNSAEETMTNELTPKSTWQRWKESSARKIIEWLPEDQG
ncbi:unnamed protein product, partial [marine sediment metagenome]